MSFLFVCVCACFVGDCFFKAFSAGFFVGDGVCPVVLLQFVPLGFLFKTDMGAVGSSGSLALGRPYLCDCRNLMP